MKASLFQCSHVIIFSPQVIVSRMGTVRSTHPLTVLEQWFTVLFKTVTLFRSCKSLVLLLRGRHVLPHLELLFVAWLLLVGFAPHAAFSFSSDAGDAQGETDASLPRCLAGVGDVTGITFLLMNFLFQAKRSWRRPQVSFSNVPAVTSTTHLVL